MPGPDVRLFVLADEQRETGRDIRPVFGSPEHYMFGTRQVVFSVTRNIFRNAKQLARKGEEAPPKSSLFTGHPMCRDRILTAEGFPAPFVQKWGPWKA